MGYTIQAQSRGRENPAKLRLDGIVPGVIYGAERTSTSISINSKELEKLYEEAGQSSLIDFILDGEKAVQVIFQDMQRDPVKGNIIHVDFLQSKAGAKLDVTIALNFIGESSLVKQGGTLATPITEVSAKCLPKDLISELDVDISVLKTPEDTIVIKDLKISKNIELDEDPDSLVAKVTAALTKEQIQQRADDEDSTTPAEAPVVEGEKKEDGETSDEKPAEEKKEEKK